MPGDGALAQQYLGMGHMTSRELGWVQLILRQAPDNSRCVLLHSRHRVKNILSFSLFVRRRKLLPIV